MIKFTPLLLIVACSTTTFDTSGADYAPFNEDYTTAIRVDDDCPLPTFEVAAEVTAGERIEAGNVVVLTDGIAMRQTSSSQCASGYALTNSTEGAKLLMSLWPEREGADGNR